MAKSYRGIFQCPFYQKTVKLHKSGKRGIKCEGGEILFPDEQTVREHVSSFCGNEVNWRHCSIALSLQKYYDRKD